MGQSDWTVLTDSVDDSSLRKFVTTRITPPNGGGSFVHGFNSRVVVAGASGYFSNQTNFAPMSKGGSLTVAMKRGASGGTSGFAPMAFIGLQGPSVDDEGYLIGLGDAEQSKVILKKGIIAQQLSNLATGTGVLARSSAARDPDIWVHLRLDMVVNDTGEVRLLVFENDLDANAVTLPDWQPVLGMDDIDPGSGTAFIDDPGGVASGSLPFLDGRAGFGMWTQDVARRAYFDHWTLQRQL